MISNFSSLLEFYAAIYVSMCLDNDICRRFWSSDYYKKIEMGLKKHPFSSQLTFFDGFFSEIKAVQDKLETRSRHKGAYLLSICLLLLMYVGFEEDLKGGNNNIEEAICITLITVLVISSLYKYILKKWKYVFLCLAIQCIIVITICKMPTLADISSVENLFSFLRENIKLILLASTSFPILFQLFENWLFSRIYRGYVSYNIEREAEIYTSSKEGIKLGEKQKIHPIYLQAWSDSVLSTKNSDVSLEKLNEVLFLRLNKLTHPNIVILLWSLLCSYVRRFKLWCKSLNNYKNDILTVPHIQSPSINEYVSYNDKRFSDEYEALKEERKKTHISVREFCTQNQINLKDFIAWMRLNKPQKK